MFGKKEKKIIKIEGMSCGHCAKRVTDALEAIDAVKAKIDLDKKCAVVTAKKTVGDDALKTVVEAVGFKVVGIE